MIYISLLLNTHTDFLISLFLDAVLKLFLGYYNMIYCYVWYFFNMKLVFRFIENLVLQKISNPPPPPVYPASVLQAFKAGTICLQPSVFLAFSLHHLHLTCVLPCCLPIFVLALSLLPKVQFTLLRSGDMYQPDWGPLLYKKLCRFILCLSLKFILYVSYWIIIWRVCMFYILVA